MPLENNPRQRKRMMARLNALTARYAVNAKNLRRDIANIVVPKGAIHFNSKTYTYGKDCSN